MEVFESLRNEFLGVENGVVGTKNKVSSKNSFNNIGFYSFPPIFEPILTPLLAKYVVINVWRCLNFPGWKWRSRNKNEVDSTNIFDNIEFMGETPIK